MRNRGPVVRRAALPGTYGGPDGARARVAANATPRPPARPVVTRSW